MPSSDKQLAFSVIASSPELLNKGKNVINMSQGSSLLPKDKSHAEDSVKVVGTKRLHTDAPSSPVYHNVYVRRKVESEHSKVSSSQELKGNGRDKTKKQEDQKNMESEHSKCNSSQELKGEGIEKTKEQKEQQNMETEHSKMDSSQELKDNGSERTREHEERRVQQDQASKPEMLPLTAESGIEELEVQQTVQNDQVNNPEVAPLIAESGIKEEGRQKVQHDHVNQPEVAPEVPPLISESGIKEKDGWQKVQHDQANQPEVAPPSFESEIEEEEQQTVQHDQVNKPEVAPTIAESGIKKEVKVLHDQVKMPQATPSVADSGGLLLSEMASPVAESVGLVPSESPEKANVESIPKKNETNVASANEPPATPGSAVQGDIHSSNNQNLYWSERYNRLQTYLENCDRSSQEGYMRMLRPLSATGRSMHAIELEKRAIHLLVEEGKELHRMKALNVLGKSPPNASAKQR
ncbi:uncharacterized protein [Lolium perenne]|uniref:uncharacterized protein n=1 Tax=Lolium perenne TaxID=4522 RepID=UPI0021EA8BB3|nr:uncharacterized protein LOC127337088 [Lolium perenne]